MQSKRLLKKTGIYFIGNLATKIISALMLPIYAFYITIDDFGYFDYMQTIMAVLMPVIFIAIWEAILRYLLFENDKQKRETIIATSAGFSLFIAGIFFIGIILYGQITSSETRLIGLVGIMFLSNAFVTIWQYYVRALEENKTYVFAGIVGAIVNFTFVVLFICIIKSGLIGLFGSYILGQLVILAIIEKKLHILNRIKIRNFDVTVLKKMLLFSAPLVLNLTSIWLVSGFGRFIITNRLGTEANGLFSFASKFYIILSMFGSVVTMAIIEETIITAKTKGIDSGFAKTIETLFKIFQSIALLAVPSIVLFYAIIKNTDYYVSLMYAPWLLLYAIASIMSSNVGSVFQAIDKTKYQFITTVMGGVVTVGISVIFITSIGVYAVVIGQILGATTMLLLRYIFVNKFVDIKINWKPIIGMTVLFIGTTLICLNTHFTISFIVLAFVAVFVCFLNLSYLKIGYGMIKDKFSAR